MSELEKYLSELHMKTIRCNTEQGRRFRDDFKNEIINKFHLDYNELQERYQNYVSTILDQKRQDYLNSEEARE